MQYFLCVWVGFAAIQKHGDNLEHVYFSETSGLSQDMQHNVD